MHRTIEKKIQSIDWGKYWGSKYYDPVELLESLEHLNKFDESKAKHGLDNKVLFALGNNHAGTYYPAILEAAEILIEIEQTSEIEAVRNCAYAILNALCYFAPEVGDYIGHTCAQLEAFVQEKLGAYADST